jgi:hypothetical protein
MTTQNKRRLTATLTLYPTTTNGKVSCDILCGHYEGILDVNGYTYQNDDGHRIGLAAYVMNVGNINIVSPSYPAGALNLMVSRADFPSSIQNLAESREAKQCAEGWFLKRAWSALKASHDSKRQSKEFVDWWNAELLPPVVQQIAVERRLNARLRPGVYDSDGIPMSIARQRSVMTRLGITSFNLK